MDNSKMNALISVYDKTGIEEFAAGLNDLGWHIFASGGTAKILKNADIKVTDVSKLAGGNAILGHRVVTLSREVYAGILADSTKPEDIQELTKNNIPFIGLVCVDMYPLEEEIAKPKVTLNDVIEKTDIGGPTMLRAAAKGRRIVLSQAQQRQGVLSWLQQGQPSKTAFLEELAAVAEYEVARYVLASAKYLNGSNVTGYIAALNSHTKYGENPWQAEAGFYADNRIATDPLGLDQFTHIKGMDKSFINMTDIDRLLQTITHIAAGFELNFDNVPPMAVGVKHGNACGAAAGETLVIAVKKMLEGDTRAIFGGLVMLNGEIDKEVAEALMKHAVDGNHLRLLDGVIGSTVTTEALEVLSRKKLRVITNPALANLSINSLDNNRRVRPVRGGILEQPNYNFVLDLSAQYMEQHGKVSKTQKQDIILAWAVGSTSNSNTITLVKNGKLIGSGVGQQDRVGAGQLAISRTTIELPRLNSKSKQMTLTINLDAKKLKDCIAYSDSFFPFPDGPELLATAGVKVFLTSSGSVNDNAVIKTLINAGASVMMVPDKIGRGFYAH